MKIQPAGEETKETGCATPAAPKAGRIERHCEAAARGLELLLGYSFIAAVLLNFANVIGRYVFSRSIIGADEIDVFIMVGMTFLGAAVVTWRSTHLRMDVLARTFPPAIRMTLKFAELAFFLAFVGTAAIESLLYARQMYELGVTSDTADLPMWIPHGAVAVGLALMALAALLRSLPGLRRDDDETSEIERLAKLESDESRS